MQLTQHVAQSTPYWRNKGELNINCNNLLSELLFQMRHYSSEAKIIVLVKKKTLLTNCFYFSWLLFNRRYWNRRIIKLKSRCMTKEKHTTNLNIFSPLQLWSSGCSLSRGLHGLVTITNYILLTWAYVGDHARPFMLICYSECRLTTHILPKTL